MPLIQMLQEGGPLAMVAFALGIIGALFGVVALVTAFGGSRAGFGLGVVTLVLSTLVSGAGIAGTMWGRRQVELAVAFVDEFDRERILLVGHREAAQAAIAGVFAALLPLALGALAALRGARAQPQTRHQGVELGAVQSESSGRAVLAVVFTGISALAASGAWVTGHRPPPPTKYPFAADDGDAWDLARALDELARQGSRDGEPRDGCPALERALDAFWDAPDRSEWPRVMRRPVPPELVGWRAAANGCVEQWLAKPDDGAAVPPASAVLRSSLLHDEALRARVQARQPEPEAAQPSAGGLEREDIRRVVSSARLPVQRCYERALVKNPSLEGKLVVELVIGPSGAVTSARGEEFPDAAVVSCVTAELKKLQFPPPQGGGQVVVKYPFVFKAAR
jgi:hypothetical protein